MAKIAELLQASVNVNPKGHLVAVASKTNALNKRPAAAIAPGAASAISTPQASQTNALENTPAAATAPEMAMVGILPGFVSIAQPSSTK